MLILIQRSSIFVRTYRRYVLYKHKTSSYAYFFQRKKYIKKESFPFFLTKIGDFGVKMRRTFFDSKNLRYLYSYSEFRRNFTRMQEQEIFDFVMNCLRNVSFRKKSLDFVMNGLNSTRFNELFRKEIRSCRIGANTR